MADGLLGAAPRERDPETEAEEQQSQQRLIRIMTVVMFPLIMYAAPSGLTIYFVTNSTIAIFENRWIRAHMNKHGMLDPDKIRAEKSKKGPGFFSRLQEMAAQQQQAKETQQKGYTNPGARSARTPAIPARPAISATTSASRRPLARPVIQCPRA